MKRLVPIIVLVAISSCSKDEDARPQSILGTWIWTELSILNCPNSADNFIVTYTCTSSNCRKLTFTSDNKFTSTIMTGGNKDVRDGTYETSGTTLKACSRGSSACDVFKLAYGKSKAGLTTLTLSSRGDTNCDQQARLEKQQ